MPSRPALRALHAPGRRSPAYLLLALLALLLSGCMGGSPAKPHLVLAPAGVLTQSLLVGYDEASTRDYVSWFRGEDQGGRKPQQSAAFIDPACPLRYDYAQMSGGTTRADPTRPFIDEVAGRRGFYNPTRGEVLLLLAGRGFPSSDQPKASCGSRSRVWLPVRLNLMLGLWFVDGAASPGTQIKVEAYTPFEMAPINGDGKIDGSGRHLVSPIRLMRFDVTDENLSRVLRYATVHAETGWARRIVWFRLSDLSPLFGSAGFGHEDQGCSPVISAFWGTNDHLRGIGDLKDHCYYAQGDTQLEKPTSPLFLDDFARQDGGSPVIDNGGDDQCGAFSKDCSPMKDDNGRWKEIAAQLTILATRVSGGTGCAASERTSCRADRQKAFRELRRLLADSPGGGAFAALNAPPADMGHFGEDDASTAIGDDVFGLIVANGQGAWDKTVAAFTGQGSQWMKAMGLVGAAAAGSDPLTPTKDSVVVEPTFDQRTVMADAEWYRTHSYLFGNRVSCANGGGKDCSRAVDVMPFSTSFATSGNDSRFADGEMGGLTFTQGPLARLQLTVTDQLQGTNMASYTTDYLPLYLMARNGPTRNIVRSYNTLDPGQWGPAISGSLHDFFYGVYRSTVGSWLSDLTRAATDNLLSIPSLQRFRVAAVIPPDGTQIYPLKDSVSAALRKAAFLPGLAQTSAQLGGDLEKACVAAYRKGNSLLTSRNADAETRIPDTRFTVADCYQQNDLWQLWAWARSLMILLVVVMAIQYFWRLLAGAQTYPYLGFVVRVVLVLLLAFGMDSILKLLASGVAEVILLTNWLGAQMSDGHPYSHLWIFGTYLNTPNQDVDVWSLIALAPFTVLGLFILLIVSWFRILLSIGLLVISPIWIVSILGDPKMRFFYTTLRFALRMYLVPAVTLAFLLILFLLAKMLGISTNPGGTLLGAVVGMLMLVALAIVPLFVAKYLAGAAVQPIMGAVHAAIDAGDSASINTKLDAAVQGGGEEEAGTRRAQYLEDYRRLREIGPGGEIPEGDPTLAPGPDGMGGDPLAAAAGVSDSGAAVRGSLRSSDPGMDASFMGGQDMAAPSSALAPFPAGPAPDGFGVPGDPGMEGGSGSDALPADPPPGGSVRRALVAFGSLSAGQEARDANVGRARDALRRRFGRLVSPTDEELTDGSGWRYRWSRDGRRESAGRQAVGVIGGQAVRAAGWTGLRAVAGLSGGMGEMADAAGASARDLRAVGLVGLATGSWVTANTPGQWWDGASPFARLSTAYHGGPVHRVVNHERALDAADAFVDRSLPAPARGLQAIRASRAIARYEAAMRRSADPETARKRLFRDLRLAGSSSGDGRHEDRWSLLVGDGSPLTPRQRKVLRSSQPGWSDDPPGF